MPIYEPDGTEVKPKASEESDVVAILGGQFDETSLTLSIYSEKLDREYVTQLLGVEPTKAWNPNERHPLGLKGRTRIVSWGKWLLSSEPDRSPIEEKITWLLKNCTDNLMHWHALAQRYDICLTINGHLENWNRELLLSPKIMKMLADRELTLHVDVYFWGQEE